MEKGTSESSFNTQNSWIVELSLSLSPSMKNIYVIFLRVGPQIKLDDSHAALQRIDNRHIAGITAQLVPGQVRIVASVNVIVGQWSSHILMDLKVMNTSTYI